MASCSFNKPQLDKLYYFFVDGKKCSPNESLTCESFNAPRGDPCLEACKLVAKYGQGLNLLNIMNFLNRTENTNYTSCFPSKIYGAGRSGIVFALMCSETGDKFKSYAMKLTKISKNDEDQHKRFSNEVRLQKIFKHRGYAPKIYIDQIFSDPNISCSYNLGVILMEPVLHTYGESINEIDQLYGKSKMNSDNDKMKYCIETRSTWAHNLNRIVKDMEKNNLTHGDMHGGNIGFLDEKRNKMTLIDFGNSTDFYANSLLDLAAAASKDNHMTQYLSSQMTSWRVQQDEEKYGGIFNHMINGKLHGVDANKQVQISKAIRYKLFMSLSKSHIDLLARIVKKECYVPSLTSPRCLNEPLKQELYKETESERENRKRKAEEVMNSDLSSQEEEEEEEEEGAI